jgi:hypothetical protein
MTRMRRPAPSKASVEGMKDALDIGMVISSDDAC